MPEIELPHRTPISSDDSDDDDVTSDESANVFKRCVCLATDVNNAHDVTLIQSTTVINDVMCVAILVCGFVYGGLQSTSRHDKCHSDVPLVYRFFRVCFETFAFIPVNLVSIGSAHLTTYCISSLEGITVSPSGFRNTWSAWSWRSITPKNDSFIMTSSSTPSLVKILKTFDSKTSLFTTSHSVKSNWCTWRSAGVSLTRVRSKTWRHVERILSIRCSWTRHSNALTSFRRASFELTSVTTHDFRWRQRIAKLTLSLRSARGRCSSRRSSVNLQSFQLQSQTRLSCTNLVECQP